MPVIETTRLGLREVTAADAAFVFALMTAPEYVQYIGDRGLRTISDARAYITDKFLPSYSKFGFGLWVAELKSSGQPIGICGFVRRDALEHPDIGFAFQREHWGQGFAHEAASAVLQHGFTRLGMATILGVVSPQNAASIRLLEKLGLRFSHLARVPPNAHDSMLFSIARPPAKPNQPADLM